MRVINQVKVLPKSKLRLYHVKGESVKFVVTDDEDQTGFSSLELNLLVDETKDSLEFELVCNKNDSEGETITIASCIENTKHVYERCVVFLDKFKKIADSVSNITGNYFSIRSVVNFNKINLKKKTLQIYDYSVETKLPVNVFECEFKTCPIQIELLTDKLHDLLTCNMIQ